MDEKRTITVIGRLSRIGGNYLGIRIPYDLMEKEKLKTATYVQVTLEILEEKKI